MANVGVNAKIGLFETSSVLKFTQNCKYIIVIIVNFGHNSDLWLEIQANGWAMGWWVLNTVCSLLSATFEAIFSENPSQISRYTTNKMHTFSPLHGCSSYIYEQPSSLVCRRWPPLRYSHKKIRSVFRTFDDVIRIQRITFKHIELKSALGRLFPVSY